MPLLERNIENAVVKWAKKHGFLTPKVRFAENGYPDRLFISPLGHTIFIEFKRPGEKPAKIQEYRISELVDRHIPATWVDNELEAISILKSALDSEAVSGTSDSLAAVTEFRRPVLGSGVGEDLNDTGDIQNTEE